VFGYDPNVDDYYIYPGSIDVNTDTNGIDDYGTLVANKTKYPDGTYVGIDSNAMTIEMASLYYPTGHTSPNAPNDSGVLFKFIVDPVPVGDTNVIIQENAKRGGIVMEDANGPSSTNLPVASCTVTGGCFDSDHPDFSAWEDVNTPDCWCYTYQCYGDADGLELGDIKAGYYYVEYQDLGILINSWKKNWGEAGFDICADFNRSKDGDIKAGYFRVEYLDLGILINNWKADGSAKGDVWKADPNCGGDLTP
jgi:hypothetical protein